MLSKKTLITTTTIIILALAVGGVYSYKKNLIPFGKKPVAEVLTPEKLLAAFVIKNSNLTAQEAQLFQQRFDETKKTLQSSPDDFSSWLYLGVLKKGVSDYEGARDVFAYAGRLRPGNSTSFGNLADLYTYFLNDPVKAEISIKQAIANGPNDYNFYISLADLYRYKFSDGAVKYEQTMLDAIAKFPDNANLIASLAGFYRETNQTQKAIEWYEKLVKLSPENQMAKEDLVELRKK